MGMNPEKGALSMIYAATAPEVEGEPIMAQLASLKLLGILQKSNLMLNPTI